MNQKREMKDNSEELELKYVDQKYEGLEAWIRRGQSDWIRLDFILEYYLFNNVNLSKQYRSQLNDEKEAKQYYSLLYKKFTEETSNGKKFDFQKYLNWQRNTPSKINEALNLFHST